MICSTYVRQSYLGGADGCAACSITIIKLICFSATLAKLYGAGRGMLRIRTSAQFRVSKVRGPCAPDPYRDDVLHAAGLDLHQVRQIF